MYKKILSYIILILILFSTITLISFGKNSEITEQNKLLEDLSFYCTTPNGFNEVKFEYYKKQLLKQDSDEDTKEHLISNSEELITIPNTPLITGLSNGPMDSAWPMKCHDVHHTGLSPYSTADNPGIEKWRFYEDGWIESTPVIDSNGTIYFASTGWEVIAINPDGTLKWRFSTGGFMLGSSPAIDEDGTIYVGSWDSYLYAIYPNGTLKWKFPTNGANIFSSPAIDEDGIIYFGDLGDFGYNSKIYAVNPNGTEKWHYTINNRIYSDSCIGDDGTIYIGSDDTYLYAMNPDGTLKWRFKSGDVIKAPPSIADDGTIYIGSYDDYLYALYPNGTMKWKCKIGYGTALNPSIASDGTIYVGWDHLYAVNPNGTIKWSFYMGEGRHIDGSSPAISADGTIYFGTNIGDAGGGEIIAVNPDGTERWRKMIAKNWVESSPSIAEDGTVYIGSTYMPGRGYLHACRGGVLVYFCFS
jgi:outer membrane protein assembly factor BamB